MVLSVVMWDHQWSCEIIMGHVTHLMPYLSLYMTWSRNVLSTSRSICFMSGDVRRPKSLIAWRRACDRVGYEREKVIRRKLKDGSRLGLNPGSFVWVASALITELWQPSTLTLFYNAHKQTHLPHKYLPLSHPQSVEHDSIRTHGLSLVSPCWLCDGASLFWHTCAISGSFCPTWLHVHAQSASPGAQGSGH